MRTEKIRTAGYIEEFQNSWAQKNMQYVRTEFKCEFEMKTVKQEQTKYVMRNFRERVKSRLKEDYFQLETNQNVFAYKHED